MLAIGNIADTVRERLKESPVVRMSATPEEYFALVSERDLRVEYETDEIIVMSLATPTHEQLVMNIGRILLNLFFDIEDVLVYGSNIAIAIPQSKKYYNADASAVKGKPELLSGTSTHILNPFLVVEILSKSTFQRDLSEKLITYKQIPTLDQVIFIGQDEHWVSTFTRTADPKQWLQTDTSSSEDFIIIDHQPVTLYEIYRKVNFKSA